MAYTIALSYVPATTNTDGNPAATPTKYQIGWDTASHASDGAYPHVVDDVDFTPIASGPNAGEQQTVITVPGPGKYFISVNESTADGTSAWSPEVTWTVTAAKPNSPSKLSASSGLG